MALVLPYFKLDVIDFLKSERIEAMSSACVGGYILLLCEAWTRPSCSLPNQVDELMRLGRWTHTLAEFQPVLCCWMPLKGDKTRLINVRLKQEWDQAHATVQALSEAGKRGALIKRQKHAKKPATPARLALAISPEFDQFWAAYPNKTGKKAAQRAWKNATDKPDAPTLILAVRRSQGTEQWTKEAGKYIPQPSRWLNEGRWTDQPVINNGGKQRPPPPPPKTDPIGRGLWGRTYGDPRSHGYD